MLLKFMWFNLKYITTKLHWILNTIVVIKIIININLLKPTIKKTQITSQTFF